MPEVAVVVGNPKPRSRTLMVAESLAEAVAEEVGLRTSDRLVVDLVDLSVGLFDLSSAEVRRAVDAVAASKLAVVASPTYKAAYTGLLKSFLDWFGTTGLNGVCAVPLMVGAGRQHALAVEVHLRPVLVEIGAMLPTRGLYVVEEELPQLDEVISTWLVEAGPRLHRCIEVGSG